MMTLHADMKQRAVVHAASQPWVDSPMPGVARRALHRVGDEVAQATSLVRYAPGSHFSAHTHAGGEEFLVLSGTFQDEHGDYPAGTYVRNPIGSRHIPRSDEGCVIFVKLWQFTEADHVPVVLNAESAARATSPARPGVTTSLLYQSATEEVRLERWEAGGTQVDIDLPGGGEFLVLQGAFEEGGDTFAPMSWLRLPSGSRLQARTADQPVLVWMKLGHVPLLDVGGALHWGPSARDQFDLPLTSPSPR
ncbi:cupin domain-containing protein [Ideonella margarita]|uniref:Cupin domain-containing protein n=1 Tax=Ideonella margarita TaxID=2984191 RepID=A0ABU9C749_9BURK